MSSPNEPFKPCPSPPPPINWATKPKRATATVTTDGRQLAIFIDLADFEQDGLPLANHDPNRSSLLVQQGLVNFNQLEEEMASQEGSKISSHFTTGQFSEDLSSTVSSVTATPPPSILTRAPTASPTKKKKKYYVVTVGKCAGIFCDDWYVYFYFV
jgi:hypothetical protein